MPRHQLIPLLLAALLTGTVLAADDTEKTPKDFPTGILDPETQPNEQPRNKKELRARLAAAAANWNAMVEAEQAKINPYQVRNFLGDRVQLAYVTYFVNGIRFTDLIDTGTTKYTQKAANGMVFCIVDITLESVSKITDNASLAGCELVCGADKRYQPNEMAIFALKIDKSNKKLTTFNWSLDKLQPGVPVDAQLVFEIPDESANGAMSLDITRREAKVSVRLEDRPKDDPPRKKRPATATWPISDRLPREPKPGRMELGLQEPLMLKQSVHVIDGIAFKEDADTSEGRAPEQGIYLCIESTIKNRIERESNPRTAASYVLRTEDGWMYRPVHIDIPAKVPALGTVTRRSVFLLPKACADGGLDLLVYQAVPTFQEPTTETYGWFKLK